VLAALVLNWHRAGDHLIGVEELEQHFSTRVDPKTFAAIIADLDSRGLVLALYDKESVSAVLEPAGYKEAYSLVAREIGDPPIFHVDWKKEEIISDAAAPDWFPLPEGWKWFELASTPSALLPKQAAVGRQLAPIRWDMWGVIVGVLAIVVAIWIAIA
jgi:hypothetical protein